MRGWISSLLLVGACVDPGAPAPVVEVASEVTRAASAPVLRVGDRHVYALRWQAEATRRHGGADVTGAMRLEGELALDVLSSEPDGVRLSLSFPSLATRELRVQGEAIEVDPAMLVGLRAEVLVGADGDVRSAFFDPDSPPLFRELMTGVVARLDLRGADPGPGPRRIRSGHGLVEASYRSGPGGVVTRGLEKVIRFDTAPGLEVEASALVADGRIELDDEGVPVVLELHDAADLPGERGLLADDRFSLVRLRVDRVTAAPLVEPIEVDPTGAPDLRAAARELDRQYAAGYELQDLSIAFDVAGGGLQPRTGEFSRAVAWLRAEPERASELVPLVMRATEGGRQLAFDMLSAAGTPRAQQVMRAVLGTPEARDWPERVLLVQRFAFVAEPTPESGEFLLAILEAADDAGDRELHRATLHPLGAVAHRLDDAWLAERIHGRLVALAADDDAFTRAGAIAGLGNARRRDDVPRLLGAIADADSTVRVEAASALRFWPDSTTTGALLDALADENPAVGAVALDVLRKRHYDGEADPALVHRAAAGMYHPELERAIASSLIDEPDALAEQPAARDALAAIAARTRDRELATKLSAIL